MKNSERHDLQNVLADLKSAQDALTSTPIDRGKALGRILDSIEAIESMLADKKEA